jgi:hypothetical protein
VSNDPKDWTDFAAFFGGMVGTIGSIIAGIFLYQTINLQNDQLTLQNVQRTEGMFLDALYRFGDNKTEIANKLIDDETVQLHDDMRIKIRNRKSYTEEPHFTEDQIKVMYVDKLRQLLYADYSNNTETPRLDINLNKYFQKVNALCYMLLHAEITTAQRDQLRYLFLNEFHDSEIKMICYYFYLFHDIVNSTDSNFTCTNIVKDSKIFEGELHFSDKFSREYDPRLNHFDSGMKHYIELVKNKRLAHSKN